MPRTEKVPGRFVLKQYVKSVRHAAGTLFYQTSRCILRQSVPLGYAAEALFYKASGLDIISLFIRLAHREGLARQRAVIIDRREQAEFIH